MLLLTREIGQSICIGDDVEVTIVKTRGGQIMLGITAPKAVPVHRKELKERVIANEGKNKSFAK